MTEKILARMKCHKQISLQSTRMVCTCYLLPEGQLRYIENDVPFNDNDYKYKYKRLSALEGVSKDNRQLYISSIELIL